MTFFVKKCKKTLFYVRFAFIFDLLSLYMGLSPGDYFAMYLLSM